MSFQINFSFAGPGGLIEGFIWRKPAGPGYGLLPSRQASVCIVTRWRFNSAFTSMSTLTGARLNRTPCQRQ